MPEILQAIILAIVQGLTEFLPVSSSAHLILVPKLFGWKDQGLFFDVAVHVGTLLAVVSYFRQDLANMCGNWQNKLLWAVGFGTLPVGVAGLVTKNMLGSNFRSALVIAVSTIVFGMVLAVASRFAKETRNLDSITWKDILYIGCAQAIALIPGTSRSGITLSAGLFCGFSRTEAARYSFLLAIPVILLAGGLELYKVYKEPLVEVINWPAAGIGLIVSGVTGYVSIQYFMRLLNKIGVMPFVIYRILLGILILWIW